MLSVDEFRKKLQLLIDPHRSSPRHNDASYRLKPKQRFICSTNTSPRDETVIYQKASGRVDQCKHKNLALPEIKRLQLRKRYELPTRNELDSNKNRLYKRINLALQECTHDNEVRDILMTSGNQTKVNMKEDWKRDR